MPIGRFITVTAFVTAVTAPSAMPLAKRWATSWVITNRDADARYGSHSAMRLQERRVAETERWPQGIAQSPQRRQLHGELQHAADEHAHAHHDGAEGPAQEDQAEDDRGREQERAQGGHREPSVRVEHGLHQRAQADEHDVVELPAEQHARERQLRRVAELREQGEHHVGRDEADDAERSEHDDQERRQGPHQAPRGSFSGVLRDRAREHGDEGRREGPLGEELAEAVGHAEDEIDDVRRLPSAEEGVDERHLHPAEEARERGAGHHHDRGQGAALLLHGSTPPP